MTWQHIFERTMLAGLGDDANEDRLLRSHWLTLYNYREAEWKGSASIESRFALADYRGKHEALLKELLQYVGTLQNAATAYCDILSPGATGAFGNLAGQPQLRASVTEMAIKLQTLKRYLPLSAHPDRQAPAFPRRWRGLPGVSVPM